MSHCRIALAAAAATSGLLGAAFLPAALAFAEGSDAETLAVNTIDVGPYTITPVAPETITGLYNITTAPPGSNESLQGYSEFNIANSDGTSGSFYAYESTSPYLAPTLASENGLVATSQVLYVDSGVQTLLDPSDTDPAQGYLPDGSVISILQSGPGFENIYTAIPGADGAATVTYLVQTPFGTIDLSDFINSLGFDASDVPSALPSMPGDTITGIGDPTVVAVTGLPPATIALQGVGAYEYNGNPDDTFTAVETTTKDLLGTHTQALLVTSSSGSLPVGSIYNIIDFNGVQNVYSSIPQLDGTDKITDVLYSPSTGLSLDLTSLFGGYDASAGLSDGSAIQDIQLGDLLIQANPDSAEVFTGINGLPPLNASIQGTQLFDLYHNGSDTPAGTFTADVTTMPNSLYFQPSESLLVTDSSAPTLLPEGSIIDVATYSEGYQNIYSDLPGLGAGGDNLITDTFVTPYGDVDLTWLYTMFDASAGVSPADGLASFADGPWLQLFDGVLGL